MMTIPGERILTVNAGSSSVRIGLFLGRPGLALPTPLAHGKLDGIGIRPRLSAVLADGTRLLAQDFPAEQVADMPAAYRMVELALSFGLQGERPALVGHRVVHGGAAFSEPVRIDRDVLDRLRSFGPLAPLHQPYNLAPIQTILDDSPELPQVACFDTAFHAGRSEVSQLFALPYAFYEQGVRRYGFHGLSFEYISLRLAEVAPEVAAGKVVIAHLGNGSSLAAVKDGKCMDTTMGLTPLEGLMMGTRCGSIDPAIVPFMMEKKGMTPQEADTVLNKQSGLLGICGTSDMRDVHANIEKGDEKAALAFKMLTRSIKKVLGSYFFLLGNVDSIVFTAGIGENDEFVREAVCEGLEPFGIKVDKKENHTRKPGARVISTPDSRIPVLIPTNEELEIATTTMRIVEESQK